MTETTAPSIITVELGIALMTPEAAHHGGAAAILGGVSGFSPKPNEPTLSDSSAAARDTTPVATGGVDQPAS